MTKFLLLCLSAFYLYGASSGETLFNGNCVACHTPSDATAAPTSVEMQKTYKKAFATKEKFVEFMATWVGKPDAKTALMPEAIAKYALMPELGLDQATLKDIASFLYDAPLGK